MEYPAFRSDNFVQSVKDLGGTGALDKMYQVLEDAYSEPHRHYHTTFHIEQCLIQFEYTKHLAERPAEVCVAIWFHDCVYDTQKNDNEERSAEMARRFLITHLVNPTVANRVADMILATKTHVPISKDCELLLDIDLSVLGRSRGEFEVYDQNIRKEYQWVPERQYCEGRRDVLRSFLDRKYIYCTETFRSEGFESNARTNLLNKIHELNKYLHETDS